jgi:hypothetical protein
MHPQLQVHGSDFRVDLPNRDKNISKRFLLSHVFKVKTLERFNLCFIFFIIDSYKTKVSLVTTMIQSLLIHLIRLESKKTGISRAN